MKTRLISIAVILPAVIAIIIAGNWSYTLLIAAATLLACVEYVRMLKRKNYTLAPVCVFAFNLLWLADALQYVVSGPVGQFFAYLSLSVHFADLPKGVIDTKDVIFYLSIIVASLFVATRILEARRWKG